MADKWETARRCERCLLHDVTTKVWAQEWGKDSKGCMEYMLDCPKCGWTGRSSWDGHSAFGGQVGKP